ncbi:hypothetical protein RclHR1_04060015 [Rhizophagus clarus]|uniref:Protein kinase domain-containing protein n=1 Tax=Rhizophagus clarus TaxID=94130 RepID=A0A2Z6S956_9GLOM|nr:hypothetical protein RclHR1_04060015 [Rhizophagus clarus]
MSLQDNQQCEKCGERCTNGWCKPCYISYFKNNFTNWTSKGGFSTVYSAIWKNGPLYYLQGDKKYERVGREVALKCLDNSQNITKEFLNEVKAYSIKKYNCINKIYGISQNPDTKIILWFFINDDSSYMDYFDIFSPDLSTPVGIYISDMGLCGEASNTDKTKIYGVMPYVAPEVLRGKSYTQVADIYSLGMIMYSLITGRQPFENRAHEYELALSICNGIRPEIPEIPELESNWYINIMKKCWDSNPGNRPNIESILTILNEEGKDTSLKNIMKSSK